MKIQSNHNTIISSIISGTCRWGVFISLLLIWTGVGAVWSPAQAQFVQSGSIMDETDPAFTGWGTVDSPASGVTVFQNRTDASTSEHIQNFWFAIGTQNGGSEEVSGSNQIEYYYFRFDSGDQDATLAQKYNIQYNLGVADQGLRDHILVIGARNNDDVGMALNTYDVQELMAAETDGSITPQVANETGHGVTVDSDAIGRIAQWEEGGNMRYGVEMRIPADWFSSTYAGTIEPDGSGTDPLVLGYAFSSTGSTSNLTSVGTVKDEIGDILFTDTKTGETDFRASIQLIIDQQPTNTVAGATISTVTAQVLDKDDVLVTDEDGLHQVTIAIENDPSGGSATLSGTTTVSPVNGVATFDDLVIDEAGTGYTLRVTAAGLNGDTSNSFDITEPPPPENVAVNTQPSQTAAGNTIEGPPSALVTDSNGDPVPGVDVTVSEQGGYTFDSGTTTVSTNGSGIATFGDLVINTAGTYTLVFDAAGVATDATTNAFDVVPDNASQVTFDQQPTNTTAGETISPAVTVRIEDSLGNLIDDDNTSQVSLSINNNPSGGSLSGTTTVTVSGGVATFSDLSIDAAGDSVGDIDGDGQ